MNLPPSSSFLDSVPLLLCEGDSDDLVNSFVDEWNRDPSFLQPNDFADLSVAIRRFTGASAWTS